MDPSLYYGGGAVVVAIVVTASLVRFLLGDRGAFIERDKAINELRADVAVLRADVARLTGELAVKASEKHQIAQDLAKTVIALDVVRQLADRCTCDERPLAPLREIIDKLVAELSTLSRRTRRVGDVTPETA